MIDSIPVGQLQKILDDAVASGEECGLELAIFHRGRLAADLCAGYADAARTRPVTPETPFPLFSSGKALAVTAFHMLMEETGTAYTEKVSRFWPEFTGDGKEDLQILHVLSHRTGLHLLPGVPDTSPQLADWPYMVRKMEQARPRWTPGTKCGYQGITFAWLLGELAFRIRRVPFQAYIREKLLLPLGVEKQLFFGIPEAFDRDTAEIDDSAFGGKPCWTKNFISQAVLRRGFIPSANAIGTARAAAKVFNAIIHAPLLKSETLENATRLWRAPDDPVPPAPGRNSASATSSPAGRPGGATSSATAAPPARNSFSASPKTWPCASSKTASCPPTPSTPCATGSPGLSAFPPAFGKRPGGHGFGETREAAA